MAHYAYLDEDNIVTMVIVGKDENDPPGNWEEYYGAKRTSYNTRGGIYYTPNVNEASPDQSKSFRKNFAGIGYKYDNSLDAFIPPKLYQSWILNEQTCLWDPPIPKPEGNYVWNEEIQNWQLIDDINTIQ